MLYAVTAGIFHQLEEESIAASFTDGSSGTRSLFRPTLSWSVVAERSSLPDLSSGVSSGMWVRIPAVTLVSLKQDT